MPIPLLGTIRARSLSGDRRAREFERSEVARVTHHRIWKFHPPPGREEGFAAAYAGHGIWSELFSKAKGYRGTTLLRPADADGWWLTIDRWDSLADFEAFQRDFGAEYRALDAELEGIAGQEEFVGAFED